MKTTNKKQAVKKTKLEIMDLRMKNLLTMADKVLSKFDRFNQEEISHNQSHKRIDETLSLHDQRIKNLETAKA